MKIYIPWIRMNDDSEEEFWFGHGYQSRNEAVKQLDKRTAYFIGLYRSHHFSDKITIVKSGVFEMSVQ